MAVKKGSEITKYDAQFAERAEKAAQQEKGVAGGRFITVSQGQMMSNGSPIPGSEIAVIIVDAINENRYYASDFDRDNLVPPDCYAHGRDDDEMAPDPEHVINMQAEDCKSCPLNVFGSSDKGRGKACGNGRRLALKSVGSFSRNGDLNELPAGDILKGDTMYLRLPPTALRAWAAYVKEVKSLHNRPPFGVMTRIHTQPDPNTTVKFTFQCIDKIPAEVTEGIFKVNEDEQKVIAFPYQKDVAAAQPKRKGSGGGRGRAAPAQDAPRTSARKPAAQAAGAPGPQAGTSRRRSAGAAEAAPAPAAEQTRQIRRVQRTANDKF